MKVFRSGHYSFSPNHDRDISGIQNSTPKKRDFILNSKMAKMFRSRAINLYNRAIYKPQSQILTYHVDKESQPYPDLNRYLTNLRQNYNLNAYCSALEITKRNQYHFHLLMDMPYTKTDKLNDAWIKASRSAWAGNSLRDHRTIKQEIAVMKYCSDYLGKEQSKGHKLRKFSYSRNVTGEEHITLNDKQAYELFKTGEIKSISEFELEHCKVGRLYLDENLGDIFQAYYHEL
jgi:hypothetical protein